MKTHSLGSGVIMFITALILVTEVIFLLFVGTENPFIFLFIFLITFYLFGRSSFRYGHYKPDKLEPFIEEDRVYIFRGYDPTTNILFLVEHIHLEIPKQDPIQTEIPGFAPAQQVPTEFEPVDFEEAALYRGKVFSEDLVEGEIVIAITKEDKFGKKIIGVERYRKAA